MKYNHIKLAVDLVTSTYNIDDAFEIQDKIEEDLDMEIHINDILEHLNTNKNDDNTNININNNIYCNTNSNYNM